ncbi:uncharacterized protein LOC114642576 isoform X2 [Erpetoichthys calabaricus]|uniref:uncharacterized protein LOC114642576 isoform X2 n=1 Tax=Erpetoichthys calabaricus TaxID=27687 RepID=UPI0022341BEE|nr:uncharacterized protein LOC114642576 isoform X2 [Erpetoichthys calabaricus]
MSANSGENLKFYKTPDKKDALVTGNFLKSPPSYLFNTQTAWKKRYFILFCDSGTYHLNYYKNEHKTEQPKGKIDLSLITVLSQHPECHKKWSLLKNMFNCHLDFVLLIITKERDYFLIGESKECVDNWYNVMYSVLLCEFPSSFHGSGVVASSSKPVPYPRSLFMNTTSVEPPHFQGPQLPVVASSSKPVPYPRSQFMNTTSVEPPQFRAPQLPESRQLETENLSMKINPLNLVKVEEKDVQVTLEDLKKLYENQ